MPAELARVLGDDLVDGNRVFIRPIAADIRAGQELTHAVNLVITAKRSLAASLREVVAQYAGDADHELKRLQSIVAHASPAVDTMPELSVTQGNEASAGFFLGVDAWESVRRLFQVSESGTHVWDAAELPAIWRHMLASDLSLQLANPAEGEQIQQHAASMTLSPSNLADLLLHASPDPQLLLWTKQFGKDAVSRRDAPLPREIGRGLYFLTLAQARRQGIADFSKLSDAAIDQGVAWLLEQPWLDERVRDQLDPGGNIYPPLVSRTEQALLQTGSSRVM